MSTKFQIESGVCTGRGFKYVDADGFCAKFAAWVVKTAAAGGPEWYLVDDQSTENCDPTSGQLTNNGLGNFTAANIVDGDITTKGFDVDSAGSGDSLKIDFGAGSETDVIKLRMYMDAAGSTADFSIRYSDDDITYTDADTGFVPSVAGWNHVEWTSVGEHRYWEIQLTNSPGASADIMQIELYNNTIETNPYMVFSDTQNPAANDQAMIVELRYNAADAGHVYFFNHLAWDATTHTRRGLWSGRKLNTYDSADFAYNFRGGPRDSDWRSLMVFTRLGSSRYFAMLDGFTGNSDYLEAATVIGTLQSGVTAGSNVVLQLDTGEAANFSADKYYYIYDFDGHSWVDYCECTAVDAVTDQITLSGVEYNFPAGAVVGAYPHRFISFGNGAVGGTDFNVCESVLPYYSNTTVSAAFHDQTSSIANRFKIGYDETILFACDPDDEGYYTVQNPTIVEYQDNAGSGQNRFYGCPNNVYITNNKSYSAEQDGFTIDGENFIYLQTASVFFYSASASIATLIHDEEHTT